MLIDRPSFATALRYHRRRLGLTQVELCERLNIPVRTLQHWERGTVQPTPATRDLLVSRIANITSE